MLSIEKSLFFTRIKKSFRLLIFSFLINLLISLYKEIGSFVFTISLIFIIYAYKNHLCYLQIFFSPS
ncbi:hypothetical protein BVAVS116_H0116 (plasmid) [Borreliella valaisiana VS116]|uniref:Uncharacterized protein n=1 Tax=Borreliella valaisiana VS116 TaxID=445987 RepID=C0R931_BORVA|nr:hypothetical protein BVAVS116_H0116 [Borreliella valaisiana VS116]